MLFNFFVVKPFFVIKYLKELLNLPWIYHKECTLCKFNNNTAFLNSCLFLLYSWSKPKFQINYFQIYSIWQCYITHSHVIWKFCKNFYTTIIKFTNLFFLEISTKLLFMLCWCLLQVFSIIKYHTFVCEPHCNVQSFSFKKETAFLYSL